VNHVSSASQSLGSAQAAWPRGPQAKVQTEKNGSETNKPLAGLARRLRENEFIASLMLGSFRALQRIGINITPNHLLAYPRRFRTEKARMADTDAIGELRLSFI